MERGARCPAFGAPLAPPTRARAWTRRSSRSAAPFARCAAPGPPPAQPAFAPRRRLPPPPAPAPSAAPPPPPTPQPHLRPPPRRRPPTCRQRTPRRTPPRRRRSRRAGRARRGLQNRSAPCHRLACSDTSASPFSASSTHRRPPRPIRRVRTRQRTSLQASASTQSPSRRLCYSGSAGEKGTGHARESPVESAHTPPLSGGAAPKHKTRTHLVGVRQPDEVVVQLLDARSALLPGRHVLHRIARLPQNRRQPDGGPVGVLGADDEGVERGVPNAFVDNPPGRLQVARDADDLHSTLRVQSQPARSAGAARHGVDTGDR